MAQKKPGFMFYFEDYESLRETLEAKDIVAVLDAMVGYSKEGREPASGILSPAALICWRFLKPRLERDAIAYRDKAQKRRDAANRR